MTLAQDTPTPTYADFGVSHAKSGVHASIAAEAPTPHRAAHFAAIHPHPLTPDTHSCVLHSDGAGSKAILAWLHYQQDGDLNHFARLALDAAIMNTDDMLCVGCTDHFVLSSTLSRDPETVPDHAVGATIRGYTALAATLQQHGISLHLAGGETEDVPDQVATLALHCTAWAPLKTADAISTAAIAPGHCIVGLRADGQATYETATNSGIGSNGLSLARHLLLHHDYVDQHPAIAAARHRQHGYRGTGHLDDRLTADTPMTLGEALLSPCRTYLPIVKDLLGNDGDRPAAIIHNTGGGHTKCLRFGSEPVLFSKHHLSEPPPIFGAIAAAGVSPHEMYQVYNMGYRLELYATPQQADHIIATSRRYGVQADVIGEVTAAPKSATAATLHLTAYDGTRQTYHAP